MDLYRLRMIGKPRFTLFGLWNILRLKHYKGKISYTDMDPGLLDLKGDVHSENWYTLHKGWNTNVKFLMIFR